MGRNRSSTSSLSCTERVGGPLREPSLFRQVTLDPIARTLVWPNGADFDPETLRHWPQYKDELAARAQAWAHVTA